MIRKKGLGRGLDALLGSTESEAGTHDSVRTASLSQLQPGKYQPRTRMDEGSLAELAASIRRNGLIQPILVRPIGQDPIDGERYEIIAGERRFRAARLAGLAEVPVTVRPVADESALVMALIENIQREDLNALEEAQGVQRLIDEFGLTHEQAADAVGRSRSAVSNLLRLLNLARPVQDMLMAGDLDMGHARALLALDAAAQIVVANEIVQKRMSVRDAERRVARALAEADGAVPARTAGTSRDVERLSERLADVLAMPVRIQTRRNGAGSVRIDFSDAMALQGLLQRLGIEEL